MNGDEHEAALYKIQQALQPGTRDAIRTIVYATDWYGRLMKDLISLWHEITDRYVMPFKYNRTHHTCASHVQAPSGYARPRQ